MWGARRFVLLAGAWGIAVTMSVTGAPAGAAESDARVTVEVHGTLLVAQPDQPGGLPSYAVALADGDIVPVHGAALAAARPMSEFTGRLALPGSVVAALASRGTGSTEDALRLVDHRSMILQVTGTPTLTQSKPAATTTVHRQFVAAITNKGALGQNDRALLGHVRTVGRYWRGQSNGVSRIAAPAGVSRYKTRLRTKDCGLGSDFFDIVQEAAARFPGLDLTGGSDQLVLFVPPTCPSGGLVGEGTIGDSFATGGALIVKAGTAINGTYAHETGHNYGFEHANIRVSGSSEEYYGAYDVMGFALGGYNQLTALSTPFRVFQGITDPGEIKHVRLGLGSKAVRTSARIRPRSDHAGLRSVRVVDPDTGEAMYLDYRSGTGEDAGAFYDAHGVYLKSSRGPIHYAPGVTLNLARDRSGVDTLVVDAHGDTSLGAGSTWTNASKDLTIHVRRLSAGGAEVTVQFTPRTLMTSKPTSAGRPEVGRTLTVNRGAWTGGTAFVFSWYADGVRIAAATSRSLRLTEAQRGKRISVKVRGSRRGFESRTLVSARTRRVR